MTGSPVPVTKVQKSLWLASYCRNFIPSCAKIAAPLTDLLKKDSLLVWTDAEDKAAKTLIAHLTSAPVLTLPDFDKPCFLTTDASDAAVGVMPSQQAAESKNAPYYSMLFSSLYPDRAALPSAREGAICGLVGRQKVSTLLVRKTFHGSNRPPVIDASYEEFSGLRQSASCSVAGAAATI